MKKNENKTGSSKRILGRVMAKEFSAEELKKAMGGLEEAEIGGSSTCCCDCSCCDC